ncbi:MAG: hypothetical protein IJS21_04840 [Deltaproteobacteria bacterium]|nr:hypothetical protein [Deltaproteobacteria bacterium]
MDAPQIIDSAEKTEAPHVIFTSANGKGKTPKQAKAFLSAPPGVAAVVGSGSAARATWKP